MNIYNYIEEKAFCEGYQAALEERLYSELSVDEELDEINPRKKK